jgi:molecular chaperone GrpE
MKKIEKLETEKIGLKEKAARAVADYQNLLRRQKDEQGKMVQAARTITFSSLLQPLNHLTLAAQNLDDQGLNIVVNQFWQTLNEQGLKEIKPVGEKFNPTIMEAIEKVGEGEEVKEVVCPGYELNGQIIQVAKVKVG